MCEKVILEAIHLKKIYNNMTLAKVEALHDISLTIRKGEFVGIMGPSGSGKSSLLNTISTMDDYTSGKVLINGKNIREMSTIELSNFRSRNLGFVFQDFNLLEELTIFENISLPLSQSGITSSEIRKRVSEAASEMEISELLEKYPNECSGGEQQRAAVCRAVINNPSIILADEPTGNLDSINSVGVLKKLQNLNNNKKVTIVMVTHDPMIASFTHRILYIKDGLIDTVLERKNSSQKEYYMRINDLNSRELFFEL